MKAALLSSLAALTVVPGLCGFSVHESENPHVLQLGMRRNRHDNPVSKDRRRFKRQSGQSVDVDLYGYSVRFLDSLQRLASSLCVTRLTI
jgi:multidrug efflux pump subunit AcrB